MTTVHPEKPGPSPPQQGQPGGPPPQYVQSGPPPPQYGQPVLQYGQPIMQQPTSMTNTTVIIQQPGAVVPSTRIWKSGICGCFDDFSSCIIVCALSWLGCLECYGCHLSMRMNESCCLYVDAYLDTLLLYGQSYA